MGQKMRFEWVNLTYSEWVKKGVNRIGQKWGFFSLFKLMLLLMLSEAS
jgi:hypothetical protein